MKRILNSLVASPASSVVPIVQLGTAGTSITVSSGYNKFTTGVNPVSLVLLNPTDINLSQKLTVSITQGVTSRVVTIGGINVISAGGQVSSGKAMPNSGSSKTDIFVFEWNGTKWECIDLRFDIR